MKSSTSDLASFAFNAEFQDLPAPVVHESKRLLLDSLGCALAGGRVDKGRIAVAMAKRLGGPAEATIIGVGGRVSCAAAAFANGELIQALDYEALMSPPGHAPPLLLSAPLALAEHVNASGKDLILATAVAHEISTRMAVAFGSRSGHVERGGESVALRHSGVVSIMGGTAAAGKIMKLDAEKLCNALGIAGYLCPVGVRYKWAYTSPPTMVKHAPAGWVSQAEVTAVLLAESGYAGDTTVLDGEDGFWKFINADMWKPEMLFERLGDEWRFPARVHYKHYPCCHLMSASALGMFCSIVKENDLEPGEMEKVRVLVRPHIIDPVRTNRDIRDHISAQMSIPYPFAVAAHKIKVGADWQLPDTITNPRILEFMKKVEYDGHPYYLKENAKDALGGSPEVSAVEVIARGRTFKKETTVSDSMSDAELIAKFKSNADAVLSPDRIEQVVQSVLELEKLGDVRRLMDNLADNEDLS